MDDFKFRLESLLYEKYAGVAHGLMPEGYLEAPLAYDAIWAVALGMLTFGKIKNLVMRNTFSAQPNHDEVGH